MIPHRTQLTVVIVQINPVMPCCLILLSGNGKHVCLPISLDMSPLQYERKCPERYASAILLVPNYNLNHCQSTKSFIFAWLFSDFATSLCPSFLNTQRKAYVLFLSKQMGGLREALYQQ